MTTRSTFVHSNPSWGPLARLPPELILRIFYLSLSHYEVGWDDAPPPFLFSESEGDAWLPGQVLGKVCRAWRDFVCGEGGGVLWGEWRVCVDLDDEGEGEDEGERARKRMDGRRIQRDLQRELTALDAIANAYAPTGVALRIQIDGAYPDAVVNSDEEDEDGDEETDIDVILDETFEELGDFLVYHCVRFRELFIRAPEAILRKIAKGGLELEVPMLRGLDVRASSEGALVDEEFDAMRFVVGERFVRAALVGVTPRHVQVGVKTMSGSESSSPSPSPSQGLSLEGRGIGTNLRSLCLYTTHRALWTTTVWKNPKQDGYWLDSGMVLNEMPRLEHLTIAHSYEDWLGEDEDEDEEEREDDDTTQGLEALPTINLPNLKTLYWFHNSGVSELQYVFPRLRTPSLVHFCWNAATISGRPAGERSLAIMRDFLLRLKLSCELGEGQSGSLKTFIFGHPFFDSGGFV